MKNDTLNPFESASKKPCHPDAGRGPVCHVRYDTNAGRNQYAGFRLAPE